MAPEPAPPARRFRFNRRRALIAVLAFLAVLILAGAGYAYWSVQKTLPTINGTAKLAGLSAQVTVTRDNYGIPHIAAANIDDLYAAEGYVHAQDRLFQMFLFRAYGSGRLSEAFGSEAVDADRFFRTVGFARSAQADVQLLSPEVRKHLESYTRGVNEFIHSHKDSLPLEFGLAGLNMDDWQPADSLLVGKLEEWDLTGTWQNDVLMSDLISKVGAARAALLVPGYPASGPFVVPGANSGSSGMQAALDTFNNKIKPWTLPTDPEGVGSNNWVVDGSKSTTGKPLLANDPHLGVRNPSIWYEIQLSTSDGSYDVDGFSIAGAPGIVTGHNRDIAWGVTNTEVDVQDVFLEKLDPSGHPGQYQSGDKWLPLQLVTETIKVKDGSPVTMTVRLTNHGPLISDPLLTATYTTTLGTSLGQQDFALQWTGIMSDTLFQSVYELQTASNWNQFRSALSKWTVPGQNFVYADRQGNIGYQMTGQIPVRKKGDGSTPVPGWTGEYDWNGFIPFDSLPRAYNPPEHYVATANNKQFGPNYQYQMSGTWAPPYRINRILDLLKAKDKLSIDDFKAMQADTVSLLAQKVAPIIAGLKPQDAKGQQVVKMFQGWNGDIKADSTTATVYEAFMHQALTQTLSDDLGEDLFLNYADIEGSTALRAMDQLLDRPDDPLWDRKDTPQVEKRDDTLLTVMTNTLSNLTSALGDDMTQWQWGKLHTIQPSHPFGGQPVIGGMFNLSAVPVGGDLTTLAVGTYSLAQPFSMTAHQSYKMIIDTSNWENSLGIFATGESGQPYAKHWGDMLSVWQSGGYDPMYYTSEQVNANKEGVLTLTP